MTPPSIPVSQATAKASPGSKPSESSGAPGLFEQIQQGLQNESRPKPPAVQADKAATQHQTSQCHGKKAAQDKPSDAKTGKATAQPDVEESSELTEARPAAEPASVTKEPLEIHNPVMQLASPVIAPEVSAELLSQSSASRAGNTSNAANPLAKAIQVVQNLQANGQPLETVATSDRLGNAQPLPLQASSHQPPVPPGLSQASQQLENNLLRWTTRQQAAVEAVSTGQSATSASSISSLLTHQTQSTSPAAVPRFDVPGNINQPAWQQAVAERVVMLQHQNIQQAELKLHPAELGPVSVRLESMQDGATRQASVQFAATHADTREALEAALPRLREMFNQQGMNLARADVQQQFQQSGGQQDQPQDFSPQTRDVASVTTETNEPGVRQSTPSDNLLDLYA